MSSWWLQRVGHIKKEKIQLLQWGEKSILFQVNAVISVTRKFDSKNPLKPFKRSSRCSQDFPFMFLCLLSRILGLYALCDWGIQQTQDREAQHISIARCTSYPWGQLLARSCAHSPVPRFYLCLTHPFLLLFLLISLFPSWNHLPWHAFSSSHLHVSCKTNSSIDFTTR